MSRADESAFPEIKTETDSDDCKVWHDVHSTGGMTIREYFAGLAMQGLLASDVINDYKTTGFGVDQITALAIEHADHLLAELEKKREER